uniref:Peptidase A2 domain-containing protein n=1 Tax=Strongyloides venezuelensis TaxID=75913 RepID=A0A0K0F279_STRVS
MDECTNCKLLLSQYFGTFDDAYNEIKKTRHDIYDCDLTYDNIIKWLYDDYKAVGSIGYKYISFFNAKREFDESVDGCVSRLNDWRRAAGLSEDFLIAKIICNIQKKYRTMSKNLTDVDLNTIKFLLKDIDEEKSLPLVKRIFSYKNNFSGLPIHSCEPRNLQSSKKIVDRFSNQQQPNFRITKTTQLLPKSLDIIYTPSHELPSLQHQHNISHSSTESIPRLKFDADSFYNLNENFKKSVNTKNVKKLLMVSEWKDLLNTNYDDLLTVDTMILPSNVPLTFTLDCGARYNYIYFDALSTLKIELPPSTPTDMFVVGFNGLPIKTDSIINLNFTINGKSTIDSFYVLPLSNYAILGWESIGKNKIDVASLAQMKLLDTHSQQIQTTEIPEPIRQYLITHPSIYNSVKKSPII